MKDLTRLQLSAWAIVHLHELGEISEGIAMKLMNSPDRVSYRLTREKCEKEMREMMAADLATTHKEVTEKASLAIQALPEKGGRPKKNEPKQP